VGTKEAFYRITQEAINNVIRHAGAKRVVVGVSEGARGLVLVVHDDGVGFHVGSVTEHLGISIMRERAVAVGAHFEVASTPGVGTSVTVVQPIQ
jgi:signal transduction histidine kinase